MARSWTVSFCNWIWEYARSKYAIALASISSTSVRLQQVQRALSIAENAIEQANLITESQAQQIEELQAEHHVQIEKLHTKLQTLTEKHDAEIRDAAARTGKLEVEVSSLRAQRTWDMLNKEQDIDAALRIQAELHKAALKKQAEGHKTATTALQAQIANQKTSLQAAKDQHTAAEIKWKNLQALNPEKKRADNLKIEKQRLEAVLKTCKAVHESLPQANAKMEVLEEESKSFNARLAAQKSILETQVTSLKTAVKVLKDEASSLKPLVDLGIKIRSRYLCKTCSMSTTRALTDSDRVVCETGNAAAHRADGDLDYLMFEKELLGSKTENGWFEETYGIAVNYWDTLTRAQKHVREARAKLKGRGLNPRSNAARMEAHRLLGLVEGLKPEDLESERTKAVMKDLEKAIADFIAADRART